MEHNILPHIIHRQVLDLHLPSNRFDGNIEGQIKNLCYEALPEIDRVFSLFDEPGQITRIDRIYLDLGRLEVDKLDEVFLSRFREALIETFDKIQLNRKDMTAVYLSNGIYYERGQIRPASFKDVSGNEPDLPAIDDIKKCSTTEGIREAFLYYLDNGAYPWWMGSNIEDEAEKIFASVLDQPSPVFIRELKKLCRYSNNALPRMIYQFSNDFVESIIHLLKQESRKEILDLYETVQQYYPGSAKQGDAKKDAGDLLIARLSLELLVAEDPVVAEDIYITCLERCLELEIIMPQTLKQLLAEHSFITYSEQLKQLEEKLVPSGKEGNRLSTETGLPPVEKGEIAFPEIINDKKKDTHETEDKLDEPIDKFVYVNNAGLVLLHPFFNAFFFSLGLLNEQRRFTDEATQTRAIYLLSFLASGKPNPSEHTVPFCKFLCGLSLKTAIEKQSALSNYEIEECEQLLKAVITHWSALKNTSIDGLREGFLQRKGKLDFRENMTSLIVETRAQDILLQGLPWGISYIQLPWLSDPFNTTWN